MAETVVDAATMVVEVVTTLETTEVTFKQLSPLPDGLYVDSQVSHT